VKTKLMYMTFVSIFFIGCGGNTPSVKSQDDKIIEEAYNTMDKENGEVGDLESKVNDINSKIDKLLGDMGTTKQ